MDLQHSCLDCKRFVKCKNPDKSFGYVCDKFKIAESVSIETFQKQSTAIDPFKFDPTKEQDNDIWSILDDITQNNFMPKNLKIDDSDIPQAPNFFTFTTDPRYLNVTPYAKQIEIGANYFNEICSRCSNKSWMKEGFPVDATYEDIKENVQFFEYGVCPKCGRRKSVRINKGKLRPYVQMAVLVGQRAGKSATFDMMEAYHLHWTLKYPNLISSYGLLPSSQLHRTYTALTIAQVKQSVYDTLYGYLTTSPWFRSYNEMLDYYSTKYGESLYTIKDTFYRYRTVNTMGYVATPDIRALRGNTRVGACCCVGSTNIFTDCGIKKLKNLPSSNISSEGIISSTTPSVYMGKKDCYKVVLENGITLTASYNHRVKTLNKNLDTEWVELQNIKKGDYIAVDLTCIENNNKLPLSYSYEPFKSPFLQCLDNIKNKASFTMQDFLNGVQLNNKNTAYCWTHDLIKAGMLTKKSLGGRPTYYLYTKTSLYKHKEQVKRFTSDWEKWSITIPNYMSFDLAKLLGYLVTEGSYFYKDREIVFTNTNQKLVDDIHRISQNLLNYDVPVQFVKSYKNHKDYWSVRFSFENVRNFLRYLGLKVGSHASIKEVPWSVMDADDASKLGFIQGILLGDGSLYKNYATFNTYSYKLCRQVQQLLLSLGIFSYTNAKHKKKLIVKRAVRRSTTIEDFETSDFLYSLTIPKYFCRKLVDKIIKVNGFCTISSSPRNASVKNIFNIVTDVKDPATNKHCRIPYINEYARIKHNVSDYVYEVLTYRVPPIYSLYKKLKKHTKRYIGKYCKKVIPLINDSTLWIPVYSIKNVGKKKVYDLTVNSETHSYAANGIISHNCDELGWFMANQSGSVKYDADELHKAILNSFRTVHTATINLYKQGQDNVLNPLFGNISSPSSVNDKIMRLYEQSKTSKYIFGRKYTTWEFNPTYTRDSFSDDEQNNPVGFMRDYMCMPPSSAHPYISDLQLVKSCFSDTKNAFVLSHRNFDTKAGNKMTTAIISSNWTDSNTPKVLAIDAGRVNNSFALCLGHFDKQQDKPVFDALAEIIPDRTIPINFTHICKDVIYKIIEAYNVKMVVSDRWNSAKLLDDIEAEKGIQVEQYSVKYADFSSFKESLLNDGMLFPKLEKPINQINTLVDGYPQSERGTPMCHFALQLVTVQDDGEKTVEKGGNYTDDIFRATVLAYSYLVDKNYKPLFSGVASKSSVGGAIGSRGGMGTSTNSSAISRPTGGYTNNALGSRG